MSTTTTEIAVRDEAPPALRLPALPSLPDTDSWIRAMASIAKLAAQICDTSFVPKGLRGDDAAVTAAILTGRELGLPPMAALRHIHVVEGTPSLDAEYKRAKVLSLGHEFDILEWDNEHCVISGRRKGSKKPPLIVSYTIKDARIAQLVKDRGNYMTRPKVMMLARATTLICNAIFADVTNGLATTELLESGDDDAIADAIGAAVEMPQPERQRVTGGQARERARQARQQVQSEVADAQVVDDAPPPPEPPASEQPPSAPADYSDPRNGVIAQFDRIGVTPLNERLDYATRLLGCEPLGGIGAITGPEAERLTVILARAGNRAQLDELLKDGTAPGDG